MALTMQGNWTVRVKSKEAAFPQHIVIQGSDNANGVYENPAPGATINVQGDQWVIDLLHDHDGTDRRPSEIQITFPQRVGNVYRFDIQSNDSGADTDFNDLVLTCSTPVTGSDFIVYGQARYYEGFCLLPPCFPGFVVIDNIGALQAAVRETRLRDILERTYGARVGRLLRNPDSAEATEAFRPLLLPLREEPLLPPRQTVSTRLEPAERQLDTGQKKKETQSFLTIAEQRIIRNDHPGRRLAEAERLDLGRIVGRLPYFCSGGELPFLPLRFQEYDRSPAELAGGPYAGDGPREDLGRTFTDRNGRYIFRFRRSPADYGQEAAEDVPSGGVWTEQVMPDLIPQVLHEADGSLLHETAPRWNIDFLTRIDLCIPKSKLTVVPRVCGDNDNMISRIGNIEYGAPGNSLSAEGRISSDLYNLDCAAWRGRIEIQGCMSNPEIRYYAVRYQQAGMAAPQPIPEGLTLQSYLSPSGVTSFGVDVVTSANVDLNGTGSKALHRVYHNAESYVGNPADPYLWTPYSKILKARIYTANSAYHNGPARFLFTTYDKNGNKLPYTEEVTLYIDKEGLVQDLSEVVTINGRDKGNCALFELTDTELSMPIEVKVRVEHLTGFLNSYRVTVQKGAEPGNKAVAHVVGTTFDGAGFLIADDDLTGRNFTPTPANCLRGFRGTIDEALGKLDGDGYLTVRLAPAAGSWLDAGQHFCAFSIRLHGSLRLTDGTHGPAPFNAVPVNIGIQRAPAS